MSDTETTTEDTAVDDTPPDDVETTDSDTPLGPEGEKALQAFKQRARDAEKTAKRVPELEAELAKLREDAMSDQEKALDAARTEALEQGRMSALSEINERLFKAEVKAASAGKVIDTDLLSDPLVAQRILGFDDYPTTDGGDIDGEAISSALDKLLEAKPHLAASATRKPGSADQGARPGGTPPKPTSIEDAFAAHYNQ